MIAVQNTEPGRFYNNMVAHWDGASVGETAEALIVNRVGSRDDKWSSSTAANLTYCVSQSSFEQPGRAPTRM